MHYRFIFSSKYKEIIDAAVTRGWTKKFCKENNIYVEEHHIFCRAEYPEWVNAKWNKVLLTAAEHYEVHKELALANPDCESANSAWWIMCEKTARIWEKRLYDVTSEDYEEARKRESKFLSESRKGIGNPMYGKHLTEEQKKKISERNKGRIGKHLTEEEKKKISKAHKGKHLTEEQKKKISESTKGKKLSEETKSKISKAQKGRKHSEKEGRQKKPIVHIETGTIIKSCVDAVTWAKENNLTGVSRGNVNSCINNRKKSCGKDINKNPQHWRRATEEEVNMLNKKEI